MGEQVQLVRVNRGWEDRGCPWCLGDQVLLVGVSRGWEDRECPWCFGGAGTACEGEQGLGKQGEPW